METRKFTKRKIKLERLAGCEGCSRNCLHNQPVAVPDVAKRTKGKIFRCNDRHPEYGKNLNITEEK